MNQQGVNFSTDHGLPHRQLRTVMVLSAASKAASAGQLRPLVEGLVARGVEVAVCGPAETEARHAFTKVGAAFVPLALGAGGRGQSRTAVLAALRRVCAGADVVHADDLPAGLAVSVAHCFRLRAPRRSPHQPRGAALVLTMRRPLDPARAGHGPARALRTLLERRVVRAADLVLGATPDLVGMARSLGAVDARLAPPPDEEPAPGSSGPTGSTGSTGSRAADDTVAHVLSVYDELAVRR